MDDTQSILVQLQQMQRDTEEQISGVRKEMHEMSCKFDRAVTSHHELKLDFAVSMERIRASVELIDKNQNDLWADLHKVENFISIAQDHIKRDEGRAESRKSTINWMQWVTPILITVLGIYISIRIAP